MERKGLALNMVVLLAIALIALIIIGFLIARSTGAYRKNTSCEAAAGTCIKEAECDGEIAPFQGCAKEEVCCIIGGI